MEFSASGEFELKKQGRFIRGGASRSKINTRGWIMFSSIKSRIVALSILIVAAISALAIILTATQRLRLDSIMERELDAQNRQQLESIAKDVFYMCRAQDEALKQKLAADMNVTEALSAQMGGLAVGAKEVEWTAVNQVDKEAKKLKLPEMLLGSAHPGQLTKRPRPPPLVDEIKKLTGSTCTRLQRMNKEGDMLRVCTNVQAADGRRAIGTYIPASSDSKEGRTENPIIKKVLAGETYVGIAFVVDRWYITAYKPAKDKAGEVIGMLYVGIQQESVASLRKGISSIKVGKRGYVFVLGTEGRDMGRMGHLQGRRWTVNRPRTRTDDAKRPFMKEMNGQGARRRRRRDILQRYAWKGGPKAPAREEDRRPDDVQALEVGDRRERLRRGLLQLPRGGEKSALDSMMAMTLAGAIALFVVFAAISFLNGRQDRPADSRRRPDAEGHSPRRRR
jgi:hypothetical protein